MPHLDGLVLGDSTLARHIVWDRLLAHQLVLVVLEDSQAHIPASPGDFVHKRLTHKRTAKSLVFLTSVKNLHSTARRSRVPWQHVCREGTIGWLGFRLPTSVVYISPKKDTSG